MTGYFQPREYEIICELGAGPFINSKPMGEKFSNGYVDIEFYDGHPYQGGSLVTPSAGTLLCEATRSDKPDDVNAPWGSIPNGTVDATDLAYKRPNWGGSAKYLRVSESIPVVGAVYALVRILRS